MSDQLCKFCKKPRTLHKSQWWCTDARMTFFEPAETAIPIVTKPGTIEGDLAAAGLVEVRPGHWSKPEAPTSPGAQSPMTPAALFEVCEVLFDEDARAINEEKFEETVVEIKEAIARFERDAQARAIRWVAGNESSWGERHRQLQKLAHAVAAGEVLVP